MTEIFKYQTLATSRLSLMGKLLIIVGSLLLSACVSSGLGAGPALQIDGLKFENQTHMAVSAVRLLVPATGNFVSCGNISRQSMCSTKFPETRYTGNPIEITWSQSGQIYSTGQFTLRLPEDLEPGIPAMVHVVIAGPGSAGAVIVQQKNPDSERGLYKN
jgi:hypothetical protein